MKKGSIGGLKFKGNKGVSDVLNKKHKITKLNQIEESDK